MVNVYLPLFILLCKIMKTKLLGLQRTHMRYIFSALMCKNKVHSGPPNTVNVERSV